MLFSVHLPTVAEMWREIYILFLSQATGWVPGAMRYRIDLPVDLGTPFAFVGTFSFLSRVAYRAFLLEAALRLENPQTLVML